ncbi:hypothetical protein [Streptomyces sp. Ru62]|uniref:hypothetical protein n=1 Tax=Streptomyces sp. Ru62 TaxID=2080745 RepID=UPI0035BC340D
MFLEGLTLNPAEPWHPAEPRSTVDEEGHGASNGRHPSSDWKIRQDAGRGVMVPTT